MTTRYCIPNLYDRWPSVPMLRRTRKSSMTFNYFEWNNPGYAGIPG